MKKNFICIYYSVVLLIVSLILFFLSLIFILKNIIFFVEWEILSLNSNMIVMTMLFDWMSLMFMSFVLIISSMVIFYSYSYMSSDENMDRFIKLIIMFILSMMFLIISPNLMSILLGWDGLGLVSYCLVIYFQNVKSFNAGMLTALSNRIGDVMILLSIAWMLNYGSWNYIFYLIKIYDLNMFFISLFIVLAGMTKSAQIPFSSWLPAAMAAPTPVSALVHSSTLVTAGVYLLIRFNNLLLNSYISKILLLISGLTMFMSGLGANFEFDLKKIIALSTLSQLGLMMSILSMGFYKLAFFHLLTHALFKAMLFMCAGSIIHNMKNFQDIRVMGNLTNSMPLTSMVFLIANLALCGMPFLSGFYSKDLILEIVMMSYLNFVSLFLFFFSTGLTVMYTFRLIFYSMTGELNFNSMNFLNDSDLVMMSSMMFLFFSSIISGSAMMWLIFPIPLISYLPLMMKLSILIICLLGGVMGYFISLNSLFFLNKSMNLYFMSSFCGLMWFMPNLSSSSLIFYPLFLGGGLNNLIDQGWSEFVGGQFIYKKLVCYTNFYQYFQVNNLKIYLLSIIFWIIVILMLMLLM